MTVQQQTKTEEHYEVSDFVATILPDRLTPNFVERFTLFRRNTKARELRKKKVDEFMAKKNGKRSALEEAKEEQESPDVEETDEEDHSPNTSAVEDEEELETRDAAEPEAAVEEVQPEPRTEMNNTGLLCGCL